jgi:hypothetical protein
MLQNGSRCSWTIAIENPMARMGVTNDQEQDLVLKLAGPVKDVNI